MTEKFKTCTIYQPVTETFTAWQPHRAYRPVFTFQAPIMEDDSATLEAAFEEFNVGTGSTGRRYREAGLRSLSVGDLLVINERCYGCASVGWDSIDPLAVRVVTA